MADFTERTHPISGGPHDLLSEAANDATLANWRRIQLLAKDRTSVRMQAQIKTLSEQGHSIRSGARILRLSRRTVRKYLESAAQPLSESGGWVETGNWEDQTLHKYMHQEKTFATNLGSRHIKNKG